MSVRTLHWLPLAKGKVGIWPEAVSEAVRLWPKGGGGRGHKNAQIPIGTHNFFEPWQAS